MRVKIRVKTWELPPRTRRIPNNPSFLASQLGTTSAYAENTKQSFLPGFTAGNYLRVRGEYENVLSVTMGIAELPPRTRRILIQLDHGLPAAGTTSAYAENTL